MLLGMLAGCSFRPNSLPPTAIVAATIPPSWTAVAAVGGAQPTIVGARFSSLSVQLGQTWTGDVITSIDVANVTLHTNLFDVGVNRTAPGRFHFTQTLVDAPAFLVRPYALDIIATKADGRSTTLVVPLTFRGYGVN